MKLTFAISAALFAYAAASPVLEARTNTTSGHPVPARSKRGASYNQAGAVAPLASKYAPAFTIASSVLSVAASVSWAYDWAPAPVGALPSGVEFVPMLWARPLSFGPAQAAHRAYRART
jgi:hypothetical protein